MIKYEDDCCDCATDNYPCLGNRCSLKHAKHLYCDRCGEDCNELFELPSGAQLCDDCLLSEFPRVTQEDE